MEFETSEDRTECERRLNEKRANEIMDMSDEELLYEYREQCGEDFEYNKIGQMMAKAGRI